MLIRVQEGGPSEWGASLGGGPYGLGILGGCHGVSGTVPQVTIARPEENDALGREHAASMAEKRTREAEPRGDR